MTPTTPQPATVNLIDAGLIAKAAAAVADPGSNKVIEGFNAYIVATSEGRPKTGAALGYDEDEWSAFKAAWALRPVLESPSTPPNPQALPELPQYDAAFTAAFPYGFEDEHYRQTARTAFDAGIRAALAQPVRTLPELPPDWLGIAHELWAIAQGPGPVEEAAMRMAEAMSAALAQPAAEPVAWRFRLHTDESLARGPNVRPWVLTNTKVSAPDDWEVQPLYTQPPSPQPASVQAVPWQAHAAQWLRRKALAQEHTNERYPDYVKAYPGWVTRVQDWRNLADELDRASPQPEPAKAAEALSTRLHKEI